MVFMLESLRTKNGVRSACAATMMRRSFCAAVEAVLRFHDVGDADLGLAAPDHRNDHVVAGGGLHQHVHAALFLEHLGDGGRGGVVERAGRQRGEAVGLRVRGGAQAKRGERGGKRCADQRGHGLPPLVDRALARRSILQQLLWRRIYAPHPDDKGHCHTNTAPALEPETVARSPITAARPEIRPARSSTI